MWWLRPSDKPVNGTGGAADAHQYLTELILQDGDELIGQRVGAFKGLPRSGRIVGVRRGSVVVHGADMDRWTLAEGDRLILRVDAATLLTWREQGRFRLGIGSGDPAGGAWVVETMGAPTSPSHRQWTGEVATDYG